MKIHEWQELVALAQKQSPYFQELYRDLGDISKLALADIPITDQADFWQHNTITNNRLLTAEMRDGIVFKSGGTTGNPKFSVFTREEWNSFTGVFGEGMGHMGLVAADRIANLFYAGELYASFNFIMKSIEACPVPALQFPISGGAPLDSILKTIDDFRINVLVGVPTTILNVTEHYAQNSSLYPNIKVDRIFFGGESMYPDQRKRLQAVFPGVEVFSIGYASVDAGLLGYAEAGCAPDEHRVFGKATILEIVDEHTSAPITEPGKSGKVLVTNLTRALMPIIRYPVGDIGVWSEPANSASADRKFLILGRSEEAARVGPVSLYYDDMRAFLDKAELGLQINAFQLITRHFDTRDALILKVATANTDLDFAAIERNLVQMFHLERPMFAEAAEQKKIHPLSVEWAKASEIEVNSRTGKLRRVIDQRR